MIALSGSHRVGKTTLAKAVAHHLDVPLVLTRTSSVFKEKGIDPTAALSFEERLLVQLDILYDAKKLWQEHEGTVFVSDRSPMDFLAYLIAETESFDLGSLEKKAFNDYRRLCYSFANRYFFAIAIVQPGICLDWTEDKIVGRQDRDYMECLNSDIKWLVASNQYNGLSMTLPRNELDIDRRSLLVSSFAQAAESCRQLPKNIEVRWNPLKAIEGR